VNLKKGGKMIKDAFKFFDGVRKEFSKVIWPSKKELIGATTVVLVLVAFFAVYLGALDFTFRTLAGKIFTLR
jgi:preprotein translocase subunit SecE